jgi:hypothetical protein
VVLLLSCRRRKSAGSRDGDVRRVHADRDAESDIRFGGERRLHRNGPRGNYGSARQGRRRQCDGRERNLVVDHGGCTAERGTRRADPRGCQCVEPVQPLLRRNSAGRRVEPVHGERRVASDGDLAERLRRRDPRRNVADGGAGLDAHHVGKRGRQPDRHATRLAAREPATVNSNTFELRNGSTLVAAAVSYNATTRTATVSNLSADDNVYYQVSSTTSGTRTAIYYGSLAAPNELLSLSVSYRGRNNLSSCTQVLEIRRWSDSTWVQLDSPRGRDDRGRGAEHRAVRCARRLRQRHVGERRGARPRPDDPKRNDELHLAGRPDVDHVHPIRRPD